MKRFLKPLIALVMVVALVAPAAAVAEAAPGAWGQSRKSAEQQKAATFMADNIKITQIKLSPTTKRFVNWILAGTLPSVCPIMGEIAAPQLADFVVQGCQGLATSPDPWAALGDFVPLLCFEPGQIFPDYENLFVVACRYL